MDPFYTMTKAGLESADPPVSYTEKQEGEIVSIYLPFADGAEYRFSLCFENLPDTQYYGCPHIGAELRNTRSKQSFWYMPGDSFDVMKDPDRTGQFFRTLSLLLTRPTRITQDKRLVTWRFRCDVSVRDDWQAVYTNFENRWTANIPKDVGRATVYNSPPLTAKLDFLKDELDQFQDEQP